MKITLFMTMTVNGMIAGKSGEEDFLADENWDTFTSLVNKFGNFIVGSRTYEAVGGWTESYGFDDFKNTKKIVVSHNAGYALKDGYDLAHSPGHVVDMLRKEGFKEGLLVGGSMLNASFISENLIDKVEINVEPVIVGNGIPLFHPKDFQAKLELVGVKQNDSHIIQLHYTVKQNPSLK